MATFTPPATSTVPPVLPTSSGVSYLLFRHYRTRPEGINVYVLSDGTVTETDPDGTNVYWQAAEGSPYVTECFYGGHDAYNISDATAALLISEGYTVT